MLHLHFQASNRSTSPQEQQHRSDDIHYNGSAVKKNQAFKAPARHNKTWKNIPLHSHQGHRLPRPTNRPQTRNSIKGYKHGTTVQPILTQPCPTYRSVTMSIALHHRINAHKVLQDKKHQRQHPNRQQTILRPIWAWTKIPHTGTKAPKCHHKKST